MIVSKNFMQYGHAMYRVSQKKWGFVFWATFEGVKWPQNKKLKIRDPH